MEMLQRLTRRQLDALRAIRTRERPDRGVPLKLLAATMKLTPPTALNHVTPLESLGLVARYRGKSRLTERGLRTLLEYERHHRVAETLFGGLGLGPSETCKAAREIDLALSHRTIEAVCAAEGHPSTCPHGEPIIPCSRPRGGVGN